MKLEHQQAESIRLSCKDSIDRLMSARDFNSAQCVLVLPPFASPDRPALGLHVLASLAEKAGCNVAVIYANLSFAKVVGHKLYRRLCHTPTEELVGERLFSRAFKGNSISTEVAPNSWNKLPIGTMSFEFAAQTADIWAEEFSVAISKLDATVIGVSTAYEQTLASLTILDRVKRIDPRKTLIIGGANADGSMGEQLSKLTTSIDHVFVGEVEHEFVEFLSSGANRGGWPRVIPAKPNNDLESLPPPDYSDYFVQLDAVFAGEVEAERIPPELITIPYESSRGCWWGEKHHCTFCGLNANGMVHRVKSAKKVEAELWALSEQHGLKRFLMVDNIMPHKYFSTLLPSLSKSEKKLSLFYEQKANISRLKMRLLKSAGVDRIQPGIESLSTAILQLMDKGVKAQKNIDCMRFARSEGVNIVWNLLCDFPGDKAEHYEEMIGLIPLLHHLQPPTGVGGLSIDRFSPFFDRPEQFGITNLHPLEAYRLAFGETNIEKLAYHFSGQYSSSIRHAPKLHEKLEAAVSRWIKEWKASNPPMLSIFEVGVDTFVLIDTRECSRADGQFLSREMAQLVLEGSGAYDDRTRWALDNHVLAKLDGRFGAIAMAPLDSPAWQPEVLHLESALEADSPH